MRIVLGDMTYWPDCRVEDAKDWKVQVDHRTATRWSLALSQDALVQCRLPGTVVVIWYGPLGDVCLCSNIAALVVRERRYVDAVPACFDRQREPWWIAVVSGIVAGQRQSHLRSNVGRDRSCGCLQKEVAPRQVGQGRAGSRGCDEPEVVRVGQDYWEVLAHDELLPRARVILQYVDCSPPFRDSTR